jgi:pSer/pThr/pTyr-binding forkhead associated (FHA) protein
VSIERLDSLVPEQVESADSDETDAALVDQWGRKHALRATMPIGRAPADGLALRQASVSLKHATLTYDDDADHWYVTDVGSKNGTYLNGTALHAQQPARLADGDLVVFGDIGFVFHADRRSIPASTESIPSSATVETRQRRIQLVLHKPTTEGAGVVTFGDETVTLGSTQFALLTLLAERYLETKTDSAETRGYVRSIELIAGLPWNTAHPEDNHVKQQVRRIRRAFERIGVPDVIESKHGFGYRLRLPPVIER